jgi:hypothetical protein
VRHAAEVRARKVLGQDLGLCASSLVVVVVGGGGEGWLCVCVSATF